MPVNHTEKAFEDAIEHHLLTSSGYVKADPANFDRERTVFSNLTENSPVL